MRRSLLLILIPALAKPLGAQADSTRKTPAANANADSSEAPKNSMGAGISGGLLRFPRNAQESALGATVAAHLWGWVDVSVNPTYAWATAADTTIGTRTIKGRTASGFAALPVSIGISHDLDGPWSPSFSIGLGFSLPTGDTASVGSAHAGYGANLDFGVSPYEKLSLDLGVSHALNSSYATGIGNSSATSLSASSTLKAGSVGISATYSGDVGPVALGYETAQSFGGGINIPIHGDLALTLDGSAGLTPGAPTWTSSIGLGFTPSGVASVMLSPIARTRAAFGAGNKTTKTKPKAKGKKAGTTG
jgi:hypothetical protein